MSATTILNIILVIFAILGGIDYVLDNRFGLAKGFDRGIKCAGPLILCMVGFMTLANWFGTVLSPMVGPFLTKIGADPSLIAGLLLAMDSGGAVLAENMALEPGAVILNGWLVASMFGSALNGNIPLSVMAVTKERRKPVLLGLAMGIASIPFGCAIGAAIAGISFRTAFFNLLPLLILSALIVAALLLFGERLTGVLRVLSKLNVLICVVGVVIAALGELCGIEVLKSRIPLSDIMLIIGRIVLTLCGMFPLMNLALRTVRKPLALLGERLGLEGLDLKGLIMNLVNSFASIDRLQEMSDMGIMLNCAFGVGAGYLLGDHFAYVSAVRPELTLPVLAGKLSAGIISILLVVLIFRRKRKA